MVVGEIDKEKCVYEEDDWRITIHPGLDDRKTWPYIVHDCNDDPSLETTQCIVLQAPRAGLSEYEYIKQMKCQMCLIRPPDSVITLWLFLTWDNE